MAFALWEKPHAPKRKAGEESAAEEKESSDVDVPEGTNVALRRDFDAETQRMRKKYVDCENDYRTWSFLFIYLFTPFFLRPFAISTRENAQSG